jgi:hypothetical protein
MQPPRSYCRSSALWLLLRLTQQCRDDWSGRLIVTTLAIATSIIVSVHPSTSPSNNGNIIWLYSS